jgi:histidine triad (HIT) family protein
MAGCIFCKIAKGEEKGWVVHEDDKAVAFLDAFPVTEGHVIVASKKHVEDLFLLSDDDFLHMVRVAREIAKKMRKAMKAHFVNIICAESVIKHAFIHVIPRTDYDLMGIVPDMENKRSLPKEEMDALCRKLGGECDAGRKT